MTLTGSVALLTFLACKRAGGINGGGEKGECSESCVSPGSGKWHRRGREGPAQTKIVERVRDINNSRVRVINT